MLQGGAVPDQVSDRALLLYRMVIPAALAKRTLVDGFLKHFVPAVLYLTVESRKQYKRKAVQIDLNISI